MSAPEGGVEGRQAGRGPEGRTDPPDDAGAADAPPPPSLGRLGVNLAAATPIAPAPRGAPPRALLARSLNLEHPRACACCLGGPAVRILDVRMAESSTDWALLAATYYVFGYFWAAAYQLLGGDRTALDTRLRCPVCEGCLRHEQAAPIGGALGALVGLGAPFAALVVTGPGTWSRQGLLGLALAGLALGLSVGLAAYAGRRRRGPACSEHATVRARKVGPRFEVAYGNPSYGARVAELNAGLLDGRT